MITTDTGIISAAPFIKRARHGEANLLMCTVGLSSGGTITAVFYPGPGEDSWPQKNDVVTLIRVGGFWVICGVKSPDDPARSPGEREIYSRKPDGGKAANILLDKDGNISLNGDGKRLVTYAELNQALQQLWGAIKIHTHPSNNMPSPGLVPVSLDISDSETQTVRTGG